MSTSERAQTTTSTANSAQHLAGARLRARYTKLGKLRFVSAIDLGRLWERALRKAGLPIAYSEGFSPHPKVSFPDALPLGYASTGEYVELVFAAPVNADEVVKGLSQAFPDGIAVTDAVEVPDGAPRLAKWLRASAWDLQYPPDVDEAALAAGCAALLAGDSVVVARRRKDEVTDVDVRPAIAALAAIGLRVRALVRHVEPPIRPSELQQALAGGYETSTGSALPEPTLVTRVAQGTLTGDGLSEALSACTVAVDDPPERAAEGPRSTTTMREDDHHRD